MNSYMNYYQGAISNLSNIIQIIALFQKSKITSFYFFVASSLWIIKETSMQMQVIFITSRRVKLMYHCIKNSLTNKNRETWRSERLAGEITTVNVHRSSGSRAKRYDSRNVKKRLRYLIKKYEPTTCD